MSGGPAPILGFRASRTARRADRAAGATVVWKSPRMPPGVGPVRRGVGGGASRSSSGYWLSEAWAG